MSRPKENRVRLIAHVKKGTGNHIRSLVNKKDSTRSTIGRCLDQHFSKQTKNKLKTNEQHHHIQTPRHRPRHPRPA